MDRILLKITSLTKRSIIAALGTLVIICALLVIFSHYYICCFEFFVNGRSIGFSQSSSFYDDVRADVNAQIEPDFGKNAAISEEAAIVPRIIKKSDMTSYSDFFNNIAMMSNYMAMAHTLVTDGGKSVSFHTQRDMNEAVDSLLTAYGADRSGIVEEITEQDGYVSAMNVYNAEDGERYMRENEVIHAQTVTEQTYTEPVAFEVENVESGNIYKGETRIERAGENGEKTVNARVTFLNGVETAREILSETITKEPVTQLCAIGTKTVPNGIGTGTFIIPSAGSISSRFGGRWGRQHEGVDISNSRGTPIYASDEGKVTFSGTQNGYGYIIIIDHGNGYTTRYAHCSELLKKVGDIVAQGDLIARSGNTGRSTGNHVHFEIRKDGEPVDPLSLAD